MKLHVLGIDLGKTVFHVVGLDSTGKLEIRKKCSRRQLLVFTANLEVQLTAWSPAVDRIFWGGPCVSKGTRCGRSRRNTRRADHDRVNQDAQRSYQGASLGAARKAFEQFRFRWRAKYCQMVKRLEQYVPDPAVLFNSRKRCAS
jgi:hypothetical protein